ncbi:MAG: antiterminator LoaP [Hungatella sp.]|nr:antiterminator LoaP [Hungatella sp.]
MWYVIQTLGGKEEETADMIRRRVSSYYVEDCFIPKRERLKKFHGVWNREEEILFRGYVFAASERPDGLYQELKQIPRLTKLLGREDEYFFALNQEEEELVRGIGDEKHKTSISRIEVGEGKKIRVVEGPLKGYVGDVVKVNLHKREVVVRVEFMGRPMELKMGVEMVSNKRN